MSGFALDYHRQLTKLCKYCGRDISAVAQVGRQVKDRQGDHKLTPRWAHGGFQRIAHPMTSSFVFNPATTVPTPQSRRDMPPVWSR